MEKAVGKKLQRDNSDWKLNNEKVEGCGDDVSSKKDTRDAITSNGTTKDATHSHIMNNTVQGSPINRSGKYRTYADAAKENFDTKRIHGRQSTLENIN